MGLPMILLLKPVVGLTGKGHGLPHGTFDSHEEKDGIPMGGYNNITICHPLEIP